MRGKTAKAIKRKVFQAYYDIPQKCGDRSELTRKDIKDALSDPRFKAMARSARRNYTGSGARLTDSSVFSIQEDEKDENRTFIKTNFDKLK